MQLSPELITFFSAMTPFVELKLAIPLGISLGLSSTKAMIFAISGTIIPAAIALAVIAPLSVWIRKNSKPIDKILEKTFKKTRKEHSKNFKKYGALLLLTFVAIPLPGSGAAAGALIAFLFKIEYWKGIGLISLGTIIAALILTAGSESILALTNLFY